MAAALALTTISAQIPGRNVNMVAGNKWPDGDPFLQRQNEPSIAASTRNPLHLLGGSNDYRTVDLPGLDGDEIGDAWLGLFKSFDGGQRWKSTLLPGYPQDTTAVGKTSPIHGYGAGADPVIRAGAGGMMFYAGLVFDRANPATPEVPGKSAIFVARYIDNNNQEAGDTFHYLGTKVLQNEKGGKQGDFLDKPWMAVDIPRDNMRCTIVTPGEKGPITQSIPASPVYVAYTLRSTDNKGTRYDVMFTKSSDCGATFKPPIKLNADNDRANQGATLAIDPKTGNVVIAWRRFDVSETGNGDAVMTAKYTLSTDKFSTPGVARRYPKGKKKGLNVTKFFQRGGVNQALAAVDLASFDQATSDIHNLLAFRTNAYPTMAADENGRFYMAWAERGFDAASPDPVNGDARVLVSTSADGNNWTSPQAVSIEQQRGHQLMPSLTYAGGKLMLIFYDLRETRAQVFSKYIDDKTALATQAQNGVPQGEKKRHTMDLRAVMASPGAVPAWGASVRVSDYLMGAPDEGGALQQLQVNPPNLPMFKLGTAPFMGDYVDVAAAPGMRQDASGKWVYNTAASTEPPVFHAVWTDNRDVRAPTVDSNNDGNPWNDYTPPTYSGFSPMDPTRTVPQCLAGNAGSRNQNVYTTRITGGIIVGSPGNTKQLGYRVDASGQSTGQLMQRSFVVFVQNTTNDPLVRTRTFRLSITNQPPGGKASFDQFATAPLTVIEAEVPSLSTASRTVYVTSTNPDAKINVDVVELTQQGGIIKNGGLGGVVVLNPDIDNPDIDNPDIDNPDIDNPDIDNPDIDNAEVSNPDIDNPDIDNPDIDNPDIDNPDIDNPDIDNVVVANPDIDNPDIDNPDIDNPDIDNPDIDNPDIDNPDIDNGSLTDITWAITNKGNTTAAYNVNLFFAQTNVKEGLTTQLILSRTYKTPVVQNCSLKNEARNVLVANVPDPHLVKSSTGAVSNPNDPDPENATLWLAPGESARITLRIYDPNKNDNITVTNDDGTTASIDTSFVPNEDVTPVVQQQAVDTEDVDEGVTEPEIVVQFPAPQTTVDAASTAVNTPVKLNVLANDSTAFGSTKIISLHPEGMAAHSGATAGDIVYQPSSGYLYTMRGAVDPNTNTLVGRFGLPPGGFVPIAQKADPIHGIVYGRTGDTNASLTALDTRPGSENFHRYLPMPTLSDAVVAFALAPSNKRIYAAHGPLSSGPTTPTTVSEIQITEDDNEFTHTVLRSVSLPVGVRAQQVAVNRHTNKVYVASTGSTFGLGGVFVIDMNAAVPTALRIPNTTIGAWGVVVNEASNMVFASASVGGMAAVLAIDGATNAVAVIPANAPMRFGSNDERLAVHEASGKVYLRLESVVAIIDGQRGSPTRNSLVATVNVGRENGATEVVVDEERGAVVTVGSFAFQVDVIDVATNSLRTSQTLSTFANEVAIDPINHRAFLSVFTYVQVVDLPPAPGPIVLGARIPVFIESGSILLDPTRNKGYLSLFTTGANIEKLSGAGFEGALSGINTEGRYLYSEWHKNSDRGFMMNQANEAGTSGDPGTVLGIDGATGAAIGYVDVLPNPFGLGIDQDGDKVYVGSLSAPNAHGGVAILDVSGPGEPPVTFASFTATAPSLPGVIPVVVPTYPAFPLNGSGALLGFGRHVVVNTNPHSGSARKMYVQQLGSSATSVAVYDPATNTLKPLDGIAGSPIFDAQGGANWGRAQIIRINQAANRIYIGYIDSNNVGRIVELNGTNDTFVRSWVGGSHSGRHTPSFITVNEAQQRIYVTDYTNSTVTMLDANTLTQIGAPLALPQGPSATAFNVDANRLYVSSIDSKTITALDGNTLQVISSVRLPLTAYFLWVDEVESRIYASGGDSADESGAMVITDVLGQLGTNVSVTSVGNAQHGTAVLNPLDFSVTYTPDPGYSGPDTFSYNIAAPTGTAVGTVNITVVPSVPTVMAFGEGYAVTQTQPLTVLAPGVLANDAGRNDLTAVLDQTTTSGVLALQSDGSFTYTPTGNFTGVDKFTYHVVDDALGASNSVTVTISVNPGPSLVVTTAANNGAGSLRQAINIANSEPGSTITFAIPGAGPHTIALTEALPTLLSPMTIDGYSPTQTGAQANTVVDGTDAVIKVRVSGSAIPAGPSVNGFTVNGGTTTIRGLAIGGFTGSGIFMDLAGGNTIEGNFIGTDAAGTAVSPNANGVTSQSPNNLIGGSTAASRNLISGNTSRAIQVQSRSQNGVLLYDSAGTTIKGNLIGTDRTGNAPLANGGGINISVPNVTVGGAGLYERNVISGNNQTGINAFASTFDPDPIASQTPPFSGPAPLVPVNLPTGLVVRGNYIGLGADGITPVPNTAGGGVQASGAQGVIVADNVIGSNIGAGISLDSAFDSQVNSVPPNTVWAASNGASITGNVIGMDKDGTALRLNTNAGISSSVQNVTIGGPALADGNFIASANGSNGINLLRRTNGADLINAGGSTLVQNNTIGLKKDGTRHATTQGTGITINTASNQIVGNVIAGLGTSPSFATGISLTGAFATTNTVRGNFIGTNRTFAGGLGNTGSGVTFNGTTGNTIGGTNPGDANTIVGNGGSGVNVSAFGNVTTTGAIIVGNYIGVNAAGVANPNSTGVQISPSPAPNAVTGTVIGGAAAAAANVISGNTNDGISLGGANVTGTIVRGNYIGVLGDGTTARPNTRHGVFISGANNNVIGGVGAGERNVIASNGNIGVAVQSNGTGNSLLSNVIRDNFSLGIDLDWNGVTPNDGGDADIGGNNRQNFPELTGFSQGAVTSVTINTLSFANVPGGYTLQFFANTSCDVQGSGEGQRLVAHRTGIGIGAAISIPLDELVPEGEVITATATDPTTNNTSEFSACLSLGNPSVVVNTNDSGFGSLRNAITYSNNTPGTQTISFDIPGASGASPALILLSSSLPSITQPVVIDGPLDGNLPIVEVRRDSVTPDGIGFNVLTSNVTIRGLAITKFASGIETTFDLTNLLIERNILGSNRSFVSSLGNGGGIVYAGDNSTIQFNAMVGNGEGLIVRDGATGNTIRNNGIGMSADGNTARGNTGHGMTMYNGAANNTFESNYISGNGGWGVDMQVGGGLVTGTRFWSNYVGLNASGIAVPNASGGIHVNNAPGTEVGNPTHSNFISGNNGHGLLIEGGDVNPIVQVTSNFIGTDPSGNLDRGNTGDGVHIGQATDVLVYANVISGNDSNGVHVSASGSAAEAVIRANKIGVNAAGNAAVGNGNAGIRLTNAAAEIGGANGVNDRNIIAGNSRGIAFANSGGTYNSFVRGNYIGTGANGTETGLGHPAEGVLVSSAPGTRIGGPNAGDGNYIVSNNSGITVNGIGAPVISGLFSTLIQGNTIGIRPNAQPAGNTHGILVVAPNTLIGSTNLNAAEGNIIANSSDRGISITGSVMGNRIGANSIYANATLGIDLNNDGVSANDGAADTDNGANGTPNFASIVSAVTVGGTTTVTFNKNDLNPGVEFLFEFYSSPTCHATGFGEGQTFRGAAGGIGGSGNDSIAMGSTVPAGHYITLTTTGNGPHTSEFSACVQVSSPPVINAVAPSTAFGGGQVVTLTGTNFQNGAGNVIIRSGGNDFPASSIHYAAFDGTKIIARLNGAPLGPAQLIAKNNGVESSPMNVTIQAQAAAPNFITVRNGNCGGYGGPGDTPTTWSGSQLLLVASGIDTAGTSVFFTPTGGGASVPATILQSCSWAEGDLAVHVQVPALANGSYNITLRTNAGGSESVDSNAKTLNVEDFVVNGMSGGAANGNCGTCVPPAPGQFGPQLFGTILAAQTVQIIATGQVNNGGGLVGPAGSGPCSECLDPSLPRTALIGRWSNGNWFVIGTGGMFTNPAGNDYLQLAINDRDYTDNGGQFNVRILPQ